MSKTRLRNGIQTFLSEAGEAACYALCLIDIAEEYSGKHIDVLDSLFNAVDRGYIHYNADDRNDDNNFFVEYPGLFLEMMTGVKWDVRKEAAFYAPKDGEYCVQRWERKKTGNILSHFQRKDFEPIEDSLTAKYGKIVSQRILIPHRKEA